MFSQREMEEQLSAFIATYLASISRVLSIEVDKDPQQHQIFQVCSALYSYAFSGTAPTHPQLQHLSHGGMVDGAIADVEMFLLGITSPNLYMTLYYKEDEVQLPLKAMQTVQAAVARQVLYGAERYTTTLNQDASSTSLTFSDVALLADMDEKSVRNAANPKNKDPLITTVSGRRTLITPWDAQRWLLKRRGFVPCPGIDFPNYGE